MKINGDVKLPPAFLPNYLGLKSGGAYSRALVLRIREQLRSLLFVESTGNPTVTFSDTEATVNLFLQKKRASRFDFIIGLLPRPDATDGKLLLTGSLSAAFLNALSLGERFAVEFERLRPETQKLDVQMGIPYVFGTPFGGGGRLHIFAATAPGWMRKAKQGCNTCLQVAITSSFLGKQESVAAND
ncbi:MAG: hypothetical protein IPK76_01825 [Lewinellaceae bacterium]|nr:hypothetical protein [Lewinellaceae bacterium]